jgi:[acyl-carrier-protein] S-malonyltransferase
VINNVDVQANTQSDTIKQALVRQLYSPVRWVETVIHLKTQGVTKMVEVGPGKVLAGLVKRIDSEIEIISLSDLKSLQQYLS